MIVVVSLITAGVDTGPFDLYTNADGFTTPIAVNVPKATLTTGYTFPSVPAGTTLIRVKSLGICGNVYTVGISPGYIGPSTSTTTSTSTSSTSSTTSTTSTTTTSSVVRPTFTLQSRNIVVFLYIGIENVVNGTSYNYSLGPTYTGSNSCSPPGGPAGLIDPGTGSTTIDLGTSAVCGTVYTVRVYNGTNCMAYTDHTIALCSTPY